MDLETTIFAPTKGKDMKVEYPELATVKEFFTLRNQELAFVWYYSNRTSPFAIETDERRVISSLKESGMYQSLSENELNKYRELVFPEEINIAIKRMKQFNPSIRMRAKMMYEKALDNLEALIDADVRIMSLEEKKSYSVLIKNVNEILPDVVLKVEESFGVKTKSSKEKGSTVMDKVVKEGNKTKY